MTPKAKGGEAWDGEKDIGKSKAEFRVFINTFRAQRLLTMLLLSLMLSHAESGCQSKLDEFVFTVKTDLQKS